MNLIIGASSGLGKSLAKCFVRLGKTFLVSRKKIQLDLNLNNGKKIIFDITNGNTTKLIKLIKKNSLSNIIFTVGLIDWSNDDINISDKSSRAIVDTNFYYLARLIYQLIKKKKLKKNCLICFCSSVTTILPRHRQIMYCAAKSALNSFSKSLNFYIKVNKLNFRVANIILGYMKTEMNKSIETPIKKINTEIVASYIFLNRSKIDGEIFFPKYWLGIKFMYHLL
jgi:NAD(P)-dependent dehydrogenase (short-subunit alcohol dehydrogenase family)